jgi:S-adenosylmethionine synthetase
LIPVSLEYANTLAFYLAKARKSKAMPYLYPDGKTQVTVECNEK